MERFCIQWCLIFLAGAGLAAGQERARGVDPGITEHSRDHEAVCVLRMVVVSGPVSVAQHGEEMSEQAFDARLSRWRRDRSKGVVVFDRGFLLPETKEPVEVRFDGPEGRVVHLVPREGDLATSGVQLKARTLGIGKEVEMDVRLGLAMLTRNTLHTDPFPAKTKVPDTRHTWVCQPGTVTALTGTTGEAVPVHHAVFFQLAATRPPLLENPQEPMSYGGASIRSVDGVVPTAPFWALMSRIRPDLRQPAPGQAAVLDVFWSDEKWSAFSDAIPTRGRGWSRPSEATVGSERATCEIMTPALRLTLALARPQESTLFRLRCELRELDDDDDAAPSEAGPAIPQGADLEHDRLCESHDERWTLVVRPVGRHTHVLAFRTQFDEVRKAVAVPDEPLSDKNASPEEN